jgi:hypothetical protein
LTPFFWYSWGTQTGAPGVAADVVDRVGELFGEFEVTKPFVNGSESCLARPVSLDVIAKGFELGMNFLLQWGEVLTRALEFDEKRSATRHEHLPVGPAATVHDIEFEVQDRAPLYEAPFDVAFEFRLHSLIRLACMRSIAAARASATHTTTRCDCSMPLFFQHSRAISTNPSAAVMVASKSPWL